MADQGVRYVVRLDDINVSSGLKNMEGSAMSTERSIDSLNSTLRDMAGAFGIGFGLHKLVEFGKDAVQGAADYETAIKRIKFASEDFADGAKNIAFITSEAAKFKIPLQETTDAYGKFLAMVRGSGMAGDEVRKLHDELLLIGKVKGLDQGQLDAGVMNLGKMLEAGAMDARHLRPLEMQLSGIGKFIADEMGVSLQQLAVLRNKGKLTGIDPQVLIRAIGKMSGSLEQFLPESTSTIQSQLNDLDNQWLKFKNDLVFDNLPELRSLFETLKEGVGWLKAHESDIISFAHVVVKLGEAWVTWKVASSAIDILKSSYSGFMAGYLGESGAVVSATEAQAVAMNSLAASMERVAYASELMAGASLTGVRGLGTLGIPLASAGAAAGEVGAAEALAGVSIVSGALLVALAGASVVALANLMADKGGGVKYNGGGFYDGQLDNSLQGHFKTDTMGYNITHQANSIYDTVGLGKADTVFNTKQQWVRDTADVSAWGKMSQEQRDMISHMKGFDDKKDTVGKPKSSERIIPPNDKVTGQRVITYNITIKEINGIKQNTVQEGGKMNTADVAAEMRDIIVSIVNDSQISATN